MKRMRKNKLPEQLLIEEGAVHAIEETPDEFKKSLSRKVQKTEESENPRSGRKHPTLAVPSYPFDQQAAIVESRLQSEYSNIINYAKDKLKVNNLRISVAKKKTKFEDKANEKIKNPVSTSSGQRDLRMNNETNGEYDKAKEEMMKYIKHYHIKRRRDELRIGLPPPGASPIPPLPPQYAQMPESFKPKDLFEHRIYDIWSMNFFSKNKDEDRLSKKEQLDQIKESIKDKSSKKIIANSSEGVLNSPSSYSGVPQTFARSLPEKALAKHSDQQGSNGHFFPSKSNEPIEHSEVFNTQTQEINKNVFGLTAEEKIKLNKLRKTSAEQRHRILTHTAAMQYQKEQLEMRLRQAHIDATNAANQLINNQGRPTYRQLESQIVKMAAQVQNYFNSANQLAVTATSPHQGFTTSTSQLKDALSHVSTSPSQYPRVPHLNLSQTTHHMGSHNKLNSGRNNEGSGATGELSCPDRQLNDLAAIREPQDNKLGIKGSDLREFKAEERENVAPLSTKERMTSLPGPRFGALQKKQSLSTTQSSLTNNRDSFILKSSTQKKSNPAPAPLNPYTVDDFKRGGTVEAIKACLLKESSILPRSASRAVTPTLPITPPQEDTISPDSIVLTQPRSLSSMDGFLIHNLFNSLVSVTASGSKNDGIGYLVGEGNNHPLVAKHIGNFKGVAFISFYNRANIVWTPLIARKVVCPSDAPRIPLDNLLQIKDYADHCCMDTDRPAMDAMVLTRQMISQRLFRVRDERVVFEVFDRLCNSTREVNVVVRETLVLANHVKDLKDISRKSNLFVTINRFLQSEEGKEYNDGKCTIIPKTYLLNGHTFDADLDALQKSKMETDLYFENPLIIKPGQFSNRGIGISMAFNMPETIRLCKETLENRKNTYSVIVQEYISRPLLYKGRKFDVRCYALVLKLFDRISFFWYDKGYARTSSYFYDSAVKDNLKVHLTNEAVQVKGRL